MSAEKELKPLPCTEAEKIALAERTGSWKRSQQVAAWLRRQAGETPRPDDDQHVWAAYSLLGELASVVEKDEALP